MLLGRRRTAPYLLRDMADDVTGLMDHLGIDEANLIGASMGGMIAQTVAIRRPERVRSLVSIMSSTVNRWLGVPTRKAFGTLFARLPPGAVYLDDDSRTYYPIKYLQKYEGGRADVRVELVNVWGIENWGLDPAGFAELLRSAHDHDRGLFLPTLEAPYLPWLLRPENVGRYRFRRFPLDERRYVFRLVTADEETALAPEPPRDPVLVVGQRVGTAGVVVRTEFSDSDAIAGELRFQRNGEPIRFRLEWTAPGGQRRSGDEVTVPFGCVTAWSLLDAPRPLAPGAWRVEARSGATRLGDARFTVRPTRPEGALAPSSAPGRERR